MLGSRLLMIIGHPTAEQVATLSVGGLAVALVAHIALAETWIRRACPSAHLDPGEQDAVQVGQSSG